MRRLLTILTVLAGALAGVPAPAGATMSVDTYYDRMVRRINEVRENQVKVDACLERHAQHYAERLADGLSFAHRNLLPTITACGIPVIGEVLSRLDSRPALVVDAWLHSPRHEMVLHNERYRYVGVGVVRTETTWVVVVRFADEVNDR